MQRMKDPEHQAVRAVLSGDTETYGLLVRQHSLALSRVAFRITGNDADAEEVVQEAFLLGYRKLRSFQFRSSFGTWIYRIAVHCALDRASQKHPASYFRIAEKTSAGEKTVQVADVAADPERLLLSVEIAALQAAAMPALTPLERTAFVLRHMEDCSTSEIAAALDIEPNAAKQAVFRAIQKLRRRLAPLRRNR
jgi:RNA polymerase sigma-70 factor (ECF subfamily)